MTANAIVFFRVAVRKCSNFWKSARNFHNSGGGRWSDKDGAKMNGSDVSIFPIMCKQLAPPLDNTRHKGQAGRIGVFGGCLEYTGAPYFAAISALKVGADLAHVFCMKEAAPVIKSYSPELIVHPYLDDSSAVKKIEPWLDRLHVILIGPGLGREPSTFHTIGKLIEICRRKEKPLVIDADGLYYLAKNPNVIKDYPGPGIILTPNAMEFARLLGNDDIASINTDIEKRRSIFHLGNNITVVRKGAEDEILDATNQIVVAGGGSGRRCGGQGDLLAGSLATFFSWALQHKIDVEVSHDDRPMIACYAACRLTRECNARAFAKKGRSMVCTDMIQEIGNVFRDLFENSDTRR